MMRPVSCMGGFCSMRERCPHYLAATVHEKPQERICERGHDGLDVGFPMIRHRPAGSWELAHLVPGMLRAASALPEAAP
jgi:hypothetical protein